MKGYTDLPFQIIITGELKGDEYAAYRALTDKANEADVERIIEGVGQEKDDAVREHYRVLLRLVMAKNPEFIEAMKRGDIMTKLKYTAEQAMDLLSIPQSQRSIYGGLVGKKTR